MKLKSGKFKNPNFKVTPYFDDYFDVHDGRIAQSGYVHKVYNRVNAQKRSFIDQSGRMGQVIFGPNIHQFNDSIFYYHKLPFYFENHFETEFNGNDDLFIKDRESLSARYHYLRSVHYSFNEKTKKDVVKSMRPFMKIVDKDDVTVEELEAVADCIPPSVMHVASEHRDLLDPDTFNKASRMTSSRYSGGCLKYVRLGDRGCLVFCTGARLAQVVVKSIDWQRDELDLLFLQPADNESRGPIFQIETTSEPGQLIIWVRRQRRVEMLRLVETEEGTLKQSDPLTSVCEDKDVYGLKPMGAGLVAISHADGCVMYDFATTSAATAMWSKQLPYLSSSHDDWSELQHQLGSPRLVYTNRDHCHLLDYRTNADPHVLFSRSSPSLNHMEFLYHTTAQLSAYQMYVCSSFNACLLDMRYIGSPVSQWTQSLFSPVSYSALGPPPQDETAATARLDVAMATQMDCRHVLFQHHTATFSRSTPLNSQLGAVNNVMSLGIAAICDPTSKVTSILSLDHCSRVRCHQYHPDKGISPTTAIVDIKPPLSELLTSFPTTKNLLLSDSQIVLDFDQELVSESNIRGAIVINKLPLS